MRNNSLQSISEVIVCWNHGRLEPMRQDGKPGDVLVIPFPDVCNSQAPYSCTSGACYTAVESLMPAQRREFVMALFTMLVVRDHVPVEAADKAFMQIREYVDVVGFYRHVQFGLLYYKKGAA
jgi:hypothetical protein